ncbi:hypothetical protein CHH27_22390 [Labrenzia sp. VG12]|nr:hypothetical protein CHH27_22390 [Labrenzia sp. VG12]
MYSILEFLIFQSRYWRTTAFVRGSSQANEATNNPNQKRAPLKITHLRERENCGRVQAKYKEMRQ